MKNKFLVLVLLAAVFGIGIDNILPAGPNFIGDLIKAGRQERLIHGFDPDGIDLQYLAESARGFYGNAYFSENCPISNRLKMIAYENAAVAFKKIGDYCLEFYPKYLKTEFLGPITDDQLDVSDLERAKSSADRLIKAKEFKRKEMENNQRKAIALSNRMAEFRTNIYTFVGDCYFAAAGFAELSVPGEAEEVATRRKFSQDDLLEKAAVAYTQIERNDLAGAVYYEFAEEKGLSINRQIERYNKALEYYRRALLDLEKVAASISEANAEQKRLIQARIKEIEDLLQNKGEA